jgi:hypothetical protein
LNSFRFQCYYFYTFAKRGRNTAEHWVGKEAMYDEIDLLFPDLTVEALKQLIRINTSEFAP